LIRKDEVAKDAGAAGKSAKLFRTLSAMKLLNSKPKTWRPAWVHNDSKLAQNNVLLVLAAMPGR
jgi:hypothetical protein